MAHSTRTADLGALPMDDEAGGGLGRSARPVELIRALAVLAEPPAPEHAAVAATLGLGEPAAGAAYARVFLFQLHPYASVHLGAEGMLGGEARERVAGFWRAVGRTPPAEPDHLSALLVLYAALLDEAAGNGAAPGDTSADGRAGAPARSAMARRSAVALLHEHIAPWAFAFLDRMQDLGSPFQAGWAALLGDVLLAETAWAGPPDGVPLHLREAPPLPDPRTDGAEAFVTGLLAPVRSGIIVTGADLQALAHELDIGARVAERRRVLEQLLSQDAAGVLGALADEAAARAVRHEARVPTLGPTATFWVRRAGVTADLLRALATEGNGAVAAAGEGTP